MPAPPRDSKRMPLRSGALLKPGDPLFERRVRRHELVQALAAEVIRMRNGEDVLTQRYPWVVAFGFGLIHGLGFAGALSQIGIPEHEVPLSLLMFNLGVETGQIFFVSVVALVLAGIRRIPVTVPRGAWRLVPYAIGGLATFWTIQRIVGVIPPGA